MNARPSTLVPQTDLPVVPDDSKETSLMRSEELREERGWSETKQQGPRYDAWLQRRGRSRESRGKREGEPAADISPHHFHRPRNLRQRRRVEQWMTDGMTFGQSQLCRQNYQKKVPIKFHFVVGTIGRFNWH